MEQLIREALTDSNANENASIPLPGNKSANLNSIGNGPTINLKEFSLYTVSAVLGAGLVVGFNPCIIGILVFLTASVLSSTGRKRDLVKMVVFFSLGIFTMYFLFGLGMQRLLQTDAVSGVFRNVLTTFLLIAGLSQVFDAVRLNQGKPSIFRTDWALKYFQAGVDKRRFSSYFLIGALFSLVKIPCLSGIYLAILDLLSTQSYLAGAVYLFSFNLGVILPIIVLGSFMAVGMSPAGGHFSRGPPGRYETDHGPDIDCARASDLLAVDIDHIKLHDARPASVWRMRLRNSLVIRGIFWLRTRRGRWKISYEVQSGGPDDRLAEGSVASLMEKDSALQAGRPWAVVATAT